MEDNKTQEVENTEVLNEGGDMKVSTPETKEEKPQEIKKKKKEKRDGTVV